MTENSSSPTENQAPIFANPWLKMGMAGVAILFVGYFFVWQWGFERIYVPEDHMLVLNLKLGTVNQDPENLRVVPSGVQGVQKEVLGEGRYFYNPLMYERSIHNRVIEIGVKEIGVVKSTSGKSLPPGTFLTKKLEGEKGIWEKVLTPGKWRLNPSAYIIEKKSIIEVAPGFVGCITTKAGTNTKENPEEYIQKAYLLFKKIQLNYPLKTEKIEKNFKNLARIFEEMSLQAPWVARFLTKEQVKMFWLLKVNLKSQELGHTDRREFVVRLEKLKAQVIAILDREEENLKKQKGLKRYFEALFLARTYHFLEKELSETLREEIDNFQENYEDELKKLPSNEKLNHKLQKQFEVALENTSKAFRGEILSQKGEKGVQEKVLQPGMYYLNPEKYRVDIVEIGYRHFEQMNVKFPSKDGFSLSLDISVVWGLLPGNVPYLMKKYGNIKDIDQKVIRPQVENICKNFGSKYEAKKFIEGATRKEFQMAFTEELERVCKGRRIDVLIGLVRDIRVPEEVRRPIQKGKIADLEKEMKVEQQKTQKVKNNLVELQEEVKRGVRNIKAGTEKKIENIRAETRKTVAEIQAETEVKVAKIMKEVAKWNALRVQTIGEADAEVMTLLKTAESDKLRQNIRAIGGAKAYAKYTFTKNLPKNFKIFIRYAGPGTFWTDLPKSLKMLEKAASMKILSDK